MKTLFGHTFQVLTRAVQLRAKRHAVISSNIANVDTPGYKAKELPFEEIMKSEFSKQTPPPLPLERTDEAHIPGDQEVTGDAPRLIKERGVPNDVDLDVEMAKLMENNLQYQATIQALIKEFDMLKTASTEGGRA